MIAVSFLLAASTLAADLDALKDTTPVERAKAQTAMMKAKLGLTDAEAAKLAPLNLKYAVKMEPIIKSSKGPLMKMRAARGVEQQKEAELKTLLSADQFRKFQAAKEEMLDKLAERIREQRAHGGK
jgi:hypothetical protein